MSIRDRLPNILERARLLMPKLYENAANPVYDIDGGCTYSVKDSLRTIAIAEYLVEGNVRSFRHHLSESAKLKLQILLRAAKGEPIDESYAHSILVYQNILDALAACDFATAEALAKYTGLREDWEAKHSHPFDRAFGHALKAIVLNSWNEMPKRFDDLDSICKKLVNVDFAGYLTLYRAIVDGNLAQAQDAVAAIAKGHKNQTRRIFKGIIDEVISVWGIGAANLARSRGLLVTSADPFIPNELLVEGLPSNC